MIFQNENGLAYGITFSKSEGGSQHVRVTSGEGVPQSSSSEFPKPVVLQQAFLGDIYATVVSPCGAI